MTLTHLSQGEDLGELWGCHGKLRQNDSSFLVCLSRYPLQQFPNSQTKTQLSVTGNSAVRMVFPREKRASLENAIFHIIFPSYTSFNALFGFARARAGYYGVCVAAREATRAPRAQARRELPVQRYSNSCDAPRHTS